MTRPGDKYLSRRGFLKLVGSGMAFAGTGALIQGCAAPSAAPAATEAPAAAAPAAEPAPTEAPASAPAQAATTLKMWWWGEQEAPGLEKWLKESVDLYKQKSGNDVEMTLQDNASVIPEFQTASAAKNAPDIQFLWNGIYHMESVWLGYLEALDGLIPEETLKGSGATALSTFDGKQYRIGWYSAAPCWLYNKEMFSQAGLDPEAPPTDWEGLLQACTALKDKGFTPIVGGLKDGPWGEWYMGHGLGPNLDSPADAVNLFIGELDWREPRYHQHWTRLDEIWKAGNINNDMLSIDLYPGIDLFGAGKGAMTSVVVPLIGKQAELLGMDKVGAMVFPASGVGKMNGLPIADSQGFGISSQSEKKQVAADFLTFLHQPDRIAALYDQARALPTDATWDGAAQIKDDLFKDVWQNWGVNEEAVPYISNLMPVLFWTDAMFVNSQKIIGGEYTGAQAGENAYVVTQKWKEQNPDMVEKYKAWANDLKL
jgi:multiple sugar transport system substrate-binding protein